MGIFDCVLWCVPSARSPPRVSAAALGGGLRLAPRFGTRAPRQGCRAPVFRYSRAPAKVSRTSFRYSRAPARVPSTCFLVLENAGKGVEDQFSVLESAGKGAEHLFFGTRERRQGCRAPVFWYSRTPARVPSTCFLVLESAGKGVEDQFSVLRCLRARLGASEPTRAVPIGSIAVRDPRWDGTLHPVPTGGDGGNRLSPADMDFVFITPVRTRTAVVWNALGSLRWLESLASVCFPWWVCSCWRVAWRLAPMWRR